MSWYSILRYTFQRIRINDIHIIIGTLIVTIIGLLVACDWQSLKGDTCQKQFALYQAQYDNISLLTDDPSQCFNSFTNDTMDSECICELLNAVNETRTQCFWNPTSRVTGRHCILCREVCLDKSTSLTLAQLIPGMIVAAISFCIFRYVGTTIATYHFGRSSQVGVATTLSIIRLYGTVGRENEPTSGNWRSGKWSCSSMW